MPKYSIKKISRYISTVAQRVQLTAKLKKNTRAKTLLQCFWGHDKVSSALSPYCVPQKHFYCRVVEFFFLNLQLVCVSVSFFWSCSDLTLQSHRISHWTETTPSHSGCFSHRVHLFCEDFLSTKQKNEPPRANSETSGSMQIASDSYLQSHLQQTWTSALQQNRKK